MSGIPAMRGSWRNLDQFSPSRETIHAISPSSTRIRAITGHSREKLQCDGWFQLCGHKWLIFSLATTLVSNTIFSRWVRVATGRFRTAYTTLTRVESLADVARGALLMIFISAKCGRNNSSVQSEKINFTAKKFRMELISRYWSLKKEKNVNSNLYSIRLYNF